MSERLQKGLRIHNRNELANVRRSGTPNDIRRTEDEVSIIRLSSHYASQLEEINEEIANQQDGSFDKAALIIKKFWLEYKVSDTIGKQTKKREFENYLSSLESSYPQVYADLNQEVSKDSKGKSISKMIAMRNLVIPLDEFEKKQSF